MKIGIVTLPLRNNYGGLLQAFALQTILRRLGHEPVTFDKPLVPDINWAKYPLIVAKRLYLRIRKGEQVRLFDEFYYSKEIQVISQHTQKFVNKHIARKEISSFKEIDVSQYDTLICGSDQVWRPQYQKPVISFLGFAKKRKEKRIAYAASFGTENWLFTVKETRDCRRWIKDFDAVSVREESGVELCKDYLGVKATHVLDPTMLLSADDYVKLCGVEQAEASKGNLMCYVLEENKELDNLTSYIKEHDSLIPFSTNSKFEDPTAGIEQRIQAPVETWLRGFYDAKMVITDSFHACAFSIIFNKPFVVIGNKDRGMSRFVSLLKMFNQEYRLVSSLNEYRCNEKSIHNLPNVKLELWREKSITFLKQNL